MSPQAAYWNNRYRQNDLQWDTGGITIPLQTYFDSLSTSLRILIPGAGNAYEAEYLVRKGFNDVTVCDLALQPLRNLKARCPGFPEKNLLEADFFDLRPEHMGYDLIVEQTFFCAIDPSLRPLYFQKMWELLKPGGRLVGLLFDDVLNTDKPPFGGTRNEYRGYFEGLFNVHTYDTCYNSIPPRRGRELFINLEKPVAG